MKVVTGEHAGSSLNRDVVDFRPDDLELMEIFSAHVRQMVGEMIGRAELENALALREFAAGGQATAIVDSNTVLLYCTERACGSSCSDYFPLYMPGELPPELARLAPAQSIAGRKLIREKSGSRLTCICGGAWFLAKFPGSWSFAGWGHGEESALLAVYRTMRSRRGIAETGVSSA